MVVAANKTTGVAAVVDVKKEFDTEGWMKVVLAALITGNTKNKTPSELVQTAKAYLVNLENEGF